MAGRGFSMFDAVMEAKPKLRYDPAEERSPNKRMSLRDSLRNVKKNIYQRHARIMVDFDPQNQQTYFFENLSRVGAVDLLRACEVGTFLIRNSASDPNSYSLSVRVSYEDDSAVRHYFLERKEHDSGKMVILMNGQTFFDIPTLVAHFIRQPLCGQVTLKKAAPKQTLHKAAGAYKFRAERLTDLSFNVDEELDIIGKPEEQWWVARNAIGSIGLVPLNYLRIYNAADNQI